MANIYYDADVDLSALLTKQIAIIGYGSQGHAHALNLRDSGCTVLVGLPEHSRSRQRAEQDGWQVLLPSEAANYADIIMLLVPDQLQQQVYEQDIKIHLSTGKMLLTAHGFSLHYAQITPPTDVDVAMVAPNGPGAILRQVFTEGKGIPALWTRPSGLHRTRQDTHSCLRPCPRLHASRHHSNNVRRRNRNRPFRRTGSTLWWPHIVDSHRL